MTDTSALRAFIEARLDVDERLATLATAPPWRWVDPGGRVKQALVGDRDSMVLPSATGDVYPSHIDASHIARHDPARVLREVAAKRAILAIADEHFDPDWDGRQHTHWITMEKVLRALASVWSDHQDFSTEWSTA